MSSTNKTQNLGLSQYIATDKPTYLQDYNSDMQKIDEGIATKLNTADLLNKIYPVGCIYMSTINNSPASFIGGTWAVWGQGRVPVGVGNNGETDYTVAEATGGSDNSISIHNHAQNAHDHALSDYAIVMNTGAVGIEIGGRGWQGGTLVPQNSRSYPEAQSNNVYSAAATNQQSGTDKGNRMPYITCYMWKRTA